MANPTLDLAIQYFKAKSASKQRMLELGNTNLNTEQTILQLETAYAISEKWIDSAIGFGDSLKDMINDNAPEDFDDILKPGKLPFYVLWVAAGAAARLGDSVAFSVVQARIQDEKRAILQATRDIAQLELDQELRDDVYALFQQMEGVQSALDTINIRLRELDDAQRRIDALKSEGQRILTERETWRKRTAAVIQGYRTRDAAFRISRNEKLERYKTLFDLAARYAFLAAQAYDYETGLLGGSQGEAFINRIVQARALGVMRDGEPQFAGSNTGDPGLSSTMAEMWADWSVVKGRLGFNNSDGYGTTVSLRREFFRIPEGSENDHDSHWKNILHQGRKNLLLDADVQRHCLQIDPGNGQAVPGIVIEFSTTVTDGYNLFGRLLAAGDHAFSSSSFATKIFGVGVALEGYLGMDAPSANASTINYAGATSPSDPSLSYLDPNALAATPYVYLIPGGVDSMRSPPLGDASLIREWSVADVAVPLPFNIGGSDFSTAPLWQSGESLTEPLFALRKHQAFRSVASAAYFEDSIYTVSGGLQRSQYTNNRLIGRSVWNSKWKLVIPGQALLSDPDDGLNRFINTVKDVKLRFVTYSYSGN